MVEVAKIEVVIRPLEIYWLVERTDWMLLPHVEQEKKETKFRLDIVFYPIWIQELTEGT